MRYVLGPCHAREWCTHTHPPDIVSRLLFVVPSHPFSRLAEVKISADPHRDRKICDSKIFDPYTQCGEMIIDPVFIRGKCVRDESSNSHEILTRNYAGIHMQPFGLVVVVEQWSYKPLCPRSKNISGIANGQMFLLTVTLNPDRHAALNLLSSKNELGLNIDASSGCDENAASGRGNFTAAGTLCLKVTSHSIGNNMTNGVMSAKPRVGFRLLGSSTSVPRKSFLPSRLLTILNN